MKNKKLIFMISLYLLFIVDLIVILTGNSKCIDNGIYNFVIGFKNPSLTAILKGATFLASTKFIVVVTVLIFIITLAFKKYKLTPLVISPIAHVIFNQGVKHLVRRTRPDKALWLVQESGFSFPSGHTMISVLFYGTIMYLVNKYDLKYKNQISGICLTIMFFAGVSRIYLGVHYATDVIGGYLFGSAILISLMYLYDKKAIVKKVKGKK